MDRNIKMGKKKGNVRLGGTSLYKITRQWRSYMFSTAKLACTGSILV